MNFLPLTRLGLLPRSAIFLVAAATIIASGLIRHATDAEYAFSALALIPVIFVAWISGRNSGLFLSVLAAITWGIADITSNHAFSAEWIPIANAITRAATYIFIVLIITWLKTLLAKIEDMATHDQLTGLVNRRAFLEFGEEEMERSMRYGHKLAVVFLDLDNFKKLNDSRGHLVGDMALKIVAAALGNTLRASDIVARLGGDEFSILLPEIDYDSAAEAGNKILLAIQAAMKNYPPVSASIGVAWFSTPMQSFQSMLDAADGLMYEIKQQRKSEVMVRRFDVAGQDVK